MALGIAFFVAVYFDSLPGGAFAAIREYQVGFWIALVASLEVLLDSCFLLASSGFEWFIQD